MRGWYHGGVEAYAVTRAALEQALAGPVAPAASSFRPLAEGATWEQALAGLRQAVERGGALGPGPSAALGELVRRAGQPVGYVRINVELDAVVRPFATRWLPRLVGAAHVSESWAGLTPSGRAWLLSVPAAALVGFDPARVSDPQEAIAADARELAGEGDPGHLELDLELWVETLTDLVAKAAGTGHDLVLLPSWIQVLSEVDPGVTTEPLGELRVGDVVIAIGAEDETGAFLVREATAQGWTLVDVHGRPSALPRFMLEGQAMFRRVTGADAERMRARHWPS